MPPTANNSTDAILDVRINKADIAAFNQAVESAKQLAAKEQWKEAIAQYKTALSFPSGQGYWLNTALGSLLVKTGDVSGAIRCYREAIALNPDDPRAYGLLGLAFEQKSMLSQAINHCQKAIAKSAEPSAWMHRKLADLLSQRAKEDYQRAAASYAQAMQQQDRFYTFYPLSVALATTDALDTTANLAAQRSQNIASLMNTLSKVGNAPAQQMVGRMRSLGFVNANSMPVNPAGYYYVSEKLKIVYCSIPKNACTLFKTMLIDNSDFKDEFDLADTNVHAFLNRKNNDIDASYLLDCLGSKEYFKFVVIRNPFDRLVSGYLDKIAKHKIPESFAQDVILDTQSYLGVAHNVEKSITFSQFVDYLMRTPDNRLNDHWRPQYNFTAAVNFDFVGQFDALDDVITSLENRLNITIRTKISSHITQYRKYKKEREFHNMYPAELRRLPGMPSADALFTNSLREKINVRFLSNSSQGLFLGTFSQNLIL